MKNNEVIVFVSIHVVRDIYIYIYIYIIALEKVYDLLQHIILALVLVLVQIIQRDCDLCKTSLWLVSIAVQPLPPSTSLRLSDSVRQPACLSTDQIQHTSVQRPLCSPVGPLETTATCWVEDGRN